MPLTIELTVSARLMTALAVIHLGALTLVWWLPMTVWAQAPLAAALVASLTHSLWRLGPGRYISALALSGDDAWSWRRAGDGAWEHAELLGSYLHPALIILRLRAGSGSRRLAILLTADTVAAEILRELRVRIAGQAQA